MYPLPQEYYWDLHSPRQLVQFFYYLQALKSRLETELEEDLRSFDPKALNTDEAKARRKKWRYRWERSDPDDYEG